MTPERPITGEATPPASDRQVVYLQPAFPPSYEEDEIDLLELWGVVWSGRWLIAGLTFLATAAAVLVSLYVLPVIYRSEAVLAPVEKEQGGIGALSGLVGSLPLPISLPGGGKSEHILAFLNSRTLRERLIAKYDLLPVLYKDIWDAERKAWKVEDPDKAPTLIKALQAKALDSFFSVSQDKKSGLVTIAWQGEDPAWCAEMLRRVIHELQFFLENEYVTDARREREFVEQQLAKATAELEYWERQVPTEELTLGKITRERLAAQTVYTELRKQLELAKISEARENITFKVLDPPFVPERKYKPKRALIVALTAVTTLFLAIFLVFIRHAVQNARRRTGETEENKGAPQAVDA
ncbi:MAG TPA: hypothetical protein ENJ73_01865 [Desulfobacterales bacterium]|nr:hypothetical protein [Desulfobacterales bacterium]